MTLTETLRLKEKYLKFEDMRALDYCEKRYKEAGEPRERWQLINFLEQMLRELRDRGGYPKILLLRKKELQRRTYTIPQKGEPNPARTFTLPSHPKIPQEWINQATSQYSQRMMEYPHETHD